ncbi:hypothetical protein [Streptomyces sp. NPDC057257]|uniref:hypothetical protein n=1 Tax=Streptomyces sp. NPDC057257 TaxID=3346071 RepID=UPI00363AD70C
MVVERRDDGKIKLHQAVNHTAVGAPRCSGRRWARLPGRLGLVHRLAKNARTR